MLQFASFSFDACVSELLADARPRARALVMPRARTGWIRAADWPTCSSGSASRRCTSLPPVLQAVVLAGQPTGLARAARVVLARRGVCRTRRSRRVRARWRAGAAQRVRADRSHGDVASVALRCTGDEPASRRSGAPIANTRIYMLDAAGEPVPVGVVGRAVHRRRAGGARLSRPAGADRGALRRRSVRGRAGRAAVSHGRSGALARGRDDRVPRAAVTSR